AQDGHAPSGSRRLVGVELLRRCGGAPTRSRGPRNRERPGTEGLSRHGRGRCRGPPSPYRRAERYLAQCQQHMRRQRADFHYKAALALVRTYDTFYVEALRPANLSRRPEPKPDGTGGYLHNGASRKAGLNKSIQDAGWRRLLSILAFKAACAGK